MPVIQPDFTIARMAPDDAKDVVGMIRAIAEHVGSQMVPRVTEQSLLIHTQGERPLIDALIARDASGRAVGCCLAVTTYSTWRGRLGLYILDLYVEADFRSAGLGKQLLRTIAKRGASIGAEFIKLEVDDQNSVATQFYHAVGFQRNDHERVFFMEPALFSAFAAEP